MPHELAPYYIALWLAVGAVPVLWIRGRQALRRRKAASWKETTATIQSIDVPHRERGRRVLIYYSYFIDGYRSGEYNIFVSDELIGYELARLLKNCSICVYYDARNPDVSTCTDENLYAVAARVREQEKLREISPVSELQFRVVEPIIDSTPSRKP
jgi:hypothetical protein